ncbi:hypothetical protein APHAL10511_006693 [Amanita phalloides]|nr:hypothetical protein APHAL10511_006693 [Amanita phalloides]
MSSRSSRATKSNATTAPTKFNGKNRNNSTFWRKHALETPVATSSIPDLASGRTGSSTVTTSPSMAMAGQDQGNPMTLDVEPNSSRSMPSTSSGRRGASGSARSSTNPYRTVNATGRRKMHRIRQRISRVAEDEQLLASIQVSGLSSSGRFARLAAEKLVRKANQITDPLRPRALYRGPRLNWIEIQNINRKIDKEEAEEEGRTIEEGNDPVIPNMGEEQLRETFQRSYLVPQIIMPSVQKGKGKNKAEPNEGDTDTDVSDTDTDADGDTDAEDENKENVSLQASSKTPCAQKSFVSSPTKATEPMAPLRASNSPNRQTIVADEEQVSMTPDLNQTQMRSASTSPPVMLECVPAAPQKPNSRVGQLPASVESMTKHSADAGQNIQFMQETATPVQSQPAIGQFFPDISSQPVVQDQTAFNIAQGGGPQHTSFSDDGRYDVHQPIFTYPPAYQQTLFQSSSSVADNQFSGHAQQPQTLFSVAETQFTTQTLQPPFGANAQFIPTQDVPFSFPAVAHNPVSQLVGNGIFSNPLNQAPQLEHSAFVPQPNNVVPSVWEHLVFSNSIMPQQPPIISPTRHSRPIIRLLPVLAEDPPLNRSVLFGPWGLLAFAKEKLVPAHEFLPPGTPNSASRFNNGPWILSRKRRRDDQDVRERRKPGPLDFRNLPSPPKKKYSGRPPKGSEEDLIRRLVGHIIKISTTRLNIQQEIERKNKGRKVKKCVRFLLPDEEDSPARKKRRTDEHLDCIRGESSQSSSQETTELDSLQLETVVDPVMPGAYITQPDVADEGKSIGRCPLIGHIFSFLRGKLSDCQFQDDKHAEDYPV